MVKEWLTIAEISDKAGIPNSTCRRYLSTFETFFVVKGGNRLKKYEAVAVDILKRIKQLYDEGLETNEIHNILVNEFPLVVNGDEESENNDDKPVVGLATSEDIADIKKALEQQNQFNQELLKRLDQQQEYIESRMNERDQRLIETIRAMQEQKQALIESATSQEQQEKKGFWSRLFGK